MSIDYVENSALEATVPANVMPPEPICGPYAVPLHLWNRAIDGPVNDFLSQPGKKFRSELVQASYNIAGGDGAAPEKLLEAVETLHAGSLIVDDIEDNAMIRRGRPALHRQIGIPQAINVGNWMYFRAIELLTQLRFDPTTNAEILKRTTSVVRYCHEGQALDLSVQVSTLRQPEVEPVSNAISHLKTGGLLALASWLGATAAGATHAAADSFDKFGMQLGVGLQMQNDLVELIKCAKDFSRSDDLLNGRVTWVWAWVARNSSDHEFSRWQQRLTEAASDREIAVLAGELHHRIGDLGEREIYETFASAHRGLRVFLNDSQSVQRLDRLMTRLGKCYV